MARRPRVVSLLPSATEIVCALGFRDRLVGRSHECDYPPDVASVAVCTAPRFPLDGSSREIDANVRELVRGGLPLYEVDAQLLARLRPDVIFTQVQCDVCAVSYAEVAAAAARMTDAKVEVVALGGVSLPGVFEDIRNAAVALDAPSAGAVLIGGLQSRVGTIRSRALLGSRRPSVLCLEWLDPPMAAGNWIPELVEAAGASPVLSVPGADAPRIEWEQVAAADPDAIVLMPCGFDIARTRTELEWLARNEQWQALRAVRDRRVYVTDGNQYFNRPGPRLVDSLEILGEILRPEAFSFGREGSGWQRA
jgi:iron complex transport system substrate-binding protein